ncbi:MAG: hypothetical protein AUG50_02335 [Betaproteobacteria bacterium 13_1_20CM_3_63_8]|nr:MAG: hypothetical protein AUG50_02335 [Betaproteobacteria bacterium 13_1_20CM_3_63_8]
MTSKFRLAWFAVVAAVFFGTNSAGTIPAWTGGLTTVPTGFTNGGRRPDPYAGEKVLYSITAKNAGEYADKLSDGVKALLKKYPETFRIDVYPTHRSDAAPQWVYDNTFKNATRAKLTQNLVMQDAYGGIPFPIPKNGAEVMWNSLVRWRGEAFHQQSQAFLGTADGKLVMTVDANIDQQMPYNFRDGSLEKFNGEYLMNRLVNSGPPIRAGEAIVGRVNADDDKSRVWVYITGQRRVRKLPNACCDTPTPAAAGVMSFDEINVFSGRLDRFEWKLVGKKEMIVPYNSNRILVPTKAADVVGAHHLNPDHVRWELHRVWVVEATLAPGARHSARRSVYYVDEDSWIAVLGDRYDANNQLWKTLFQLPIAAPDIPGTISGPYGFMDLLSGTWFVALIWNEKSEQLRIVPRYADTTFTSDAMAGEGVR